jgi:vancomycin permeability regulator SanA
VAELAGLLVTIAAASAAASWVRIRRAARPRPVPRGDLIVVLGAALWGDAPCPELRRRLAHAAAIHRRGAADAILCSGGFSGGCSEALAMREELLRMGVPPGAISIDETGTSTRRSVRAVARRGGSPRVLFVSSGYHLRRVISEARRHGLDAAGAPVPERRRSLRQEAREVAALWGYALSAPPLTLWGQAPKGQVT